MEPQEIKTSEPITQGSSRKKWLIPLAIALLFGSIGAYFLIFSKAATLDTETIFSGAANAKLNDATVLVIKDNVFYASSSTDVVQLAVGKSANFSPNRGGGSYNTLRNCYYMRSPTTSTSVSITSGAAKATIIVPVDANYYHKYCVTYLAGTYPGYDVKVLSGGPVNIYQAVYEVQDISDSTTQLLYTRGNGFIYKSTAYGPAAQLVYGSSPTWGSNASTIFFIYYNGVTGVYSMLANGTNVKTLNTHNTEPVKWSKAANKLFYVKYESTDLNVNNSIYSMNPDGTGLTKLFNNPTGYIVSLQVSPNGKKLLFDTWNLNNNGQNILYTYDLATGVKTAIDNGVGGGSLGENNWSADSLKVSYAVSGAIYTRLADGSAAATAVTPNINASWITWSPDGKQFAFGANQSLYTVNYNGTGLTKIQTFTTQNPSTFGPNDIVWSPDSLRLAVRVVEGNGPYSQLFTMFNNGTNLKQLEGPGSNIGGLEWSVQ